MSLSRYFQKNKKACLWQAFFVYYNMAKKKLPSIVKEVQNKIKRDIDWTSEKLISFSQFQMYSDCPKKWSLQYREGHKQFNSTIHTVFGTALHETLQHYLTVFYEQSGAEADRINTSEMLEDTLREEYKKQYKSNNKQHFVSPEELREFYEDGVEMIRDFSKNKAKHFSKRGWYLIGCEIPITLNPHSNYNNIVYQGYLDAVLYHEPTNKIYIIDFKTSTWGWGDKDKKNETKQFQLLLYKKYFADHFNFPIENINVEFFILKRKLRESEDFVIKRIQKIQPASGKIKIKKAEDALLKFVEEAFDTNGFKEVEHQPKLNDNCKWCPFHKTHLCSATF
jgi:hypothetical protein